MENIKSTTKKWLEDWILKLNLCPFAHSVYAKKQIRFEIEESDDFKKCVAKAVSEIELLKENNDQEAKNYIDTTLLIFPNFSIDEDTDDIDEENTAFNDFLDFVGLLDLFLEQNNLDHQFQLVAFHPNYIFEGEEKESKSHYTNRSPYPILHILREESVSKAVENFGKTDSIPKKNIEKLEKMEQQEFEWLKSFQR